MKYVQRKGEDSYSFYDSNEQNNLLFAILQ